MSLKYLNKTVFFYKGNVYRVINCFAIHNKDEYRITAERDSTGSTEVVIFTDIPTKEMKTPFILAMLETAKWHPIELINKTEEPLFQAIYE